MSERGRLGLFLLGAIALVGFLLTAMGGLRPAGDYRGAYGLLLNQVATTERKITDVVSAVNFDYRAVDTLGEEFILFSSVVGVSLLLRPHADEKEEDGGEDEDEAPSREEVPPPSDAVRICCQLLVGISCLFGMYVVVHGANTPGGGFQGGVILATVPLLVYLAGDPKTFKRVAPEKLVEAAEAIGAGGFALIGLVAFAFALPFLANWIPLGPHSGRIVNGGTIPWISLVTGLEVAAGFILLLRTFLEEELKERES